MDNLSAFQKEFVDNCSYRMDESLRMITISMEKISEAQLWQKPNSSLNSIGNLVLHLCGNMTQYGIASLQETPDERNRDQEFSTEGGCTKSELLELLQKTVTHVKNSFSSVSMQCMLAHKQVQGFDFSGIGNMVHVVEHFSYHTGQIAFWVKLLQDEALGFYDGHNLNTLNDQ